MSAILASPRAFTVLSASQQPSIASAANLNRDEVAMVWRSSGLGGPFLKVQLAAGTWDTIALIGSNLRATDTIRVRAAMDASTVDGTTGLLLDQTFQAWSGTPSSAGALSLLVLPSAISATHVRLDISSTGNPAGYVEASRLLIARRVEHDGVNNNAEHGWEDPSGREEGLGYEVVDPYPTRLSWKITLDNVSDDKYWTTWAPFLREVGMKRGLMFVPEHTSPHVQQQAIFGRVTSAAKGSSPVADYNVVEIALRSLS